MQVTTPTQVYYVRASNDPRRFYLVAENPRGFLECECPSAQYRRSQPCKHTKAVARGEVRAATVKAAATPVPAPLALDALYSDGGQSLDSAVARVRGAA